MDDRFLYGLGGQPEAEFVDRLQQKLAQETDGIRWWERMQTGRHRSAVIIAVVLVMALMATSIYSPTRALIKSLIVSIAGQSFKITEDFPGDDYPGSAETIIEPQVLPLADALAAFPHPVNLPTNIPPEFLLNEAHVRIYVGDEGGVFANTIEVQWFSNEPAGLELQITDRDEGEIIAPDSAEEVLLKGNHPAVLITGGWDADHKDWDRSLALRLRWPVEDLTYTLFGNNAEQMKIIAASTLP